MIPGTQKPTLYQPGADKLNNLFGLVSTFTVEQKEEDWTGERHGGELSSDALGLSGRAGRIEHVGPCDPVRQRLVRLLGDGLLVGLVPLDDTVEHEA